MRDRLITITLWLGIPLTIYFIQSQADLKRIEEERIAEDHRVSLVRNSVESLAKQYGATNEWVNNFRSEDDQTFQPLMTIDLERAWLQSRPIVVWGWIEDIATMDSGKYKLSLETSLSERYRLIFSTALRLDLVADKQIVDKLLEENPSIVEDYRYNNAIAVIANVSNLSSEELVDQQGDVIDIKIGHGELLGVTFTGDVLPAYWN